MNNKWFTPEEVNKLQSKPFLLALPSAPYELAVWKIATVQYNYPISVDGMNYSVPYEYIRQKVDVRLTRNVVEVFFQGNRICSHPKLFGRSGQYATVVEHMPENHRRYSEWNGERFLSWAESVGSSTETVIRGILTSHKVEQQGYRACMALLKLADKYSVVRLEAACERALTYTPHPGYKSVQTILQTGQDKLLDYTAEKTVVSDKTSGTEFGFTRGAAYYGRNSK